MKRSLLFFLVILSVIPIYVFIIWIQDALISYSFQVRGDSIAAEIAREVYATAYNKNKVRELIPNILSCANDEVCIKREVEKLDKHMTDIEVDGKIAELFTKDRYTISFSQESPNVLYVRFRSFDFDFPPGINSGLPSEFISAVNFLLQAKSFQSVVIDLRNNIGGKSWISLTLASMFIPSGRVIPTHYNPSWKFQYIHGLTLPRVFTNRGIRGYIAGTMYLPSTVKPTVKAVYIVVNEYTASAAEFLGIVLKKLSNQKIVFVGDNETRGVGNTINLPTEKYGIMVTAGIIKQYPEKIVPEMSIAQLEQELGIKLE
jgi:hypothetical protein